MGLKVQKLTIGVDFGSGDKTVTTVMEKLDNGLWRVVRFFVIEDRPESPKHRLS